MAESVSMMPEAQSVLKTLLRPIRGVLDREDVSDICINGPGIMWIEGRAGWERVAIPDANENWLRSLARAVASSMASKIDSHSPVLSGHLPTGERIQLVMPPAADAISVTIRRPSRVLYSLDQLAASGAFGPVLCVGGAGHAVARRTLRAELAGWQPRDPSEVADVLRRLVQGRLNLIVSGATGSGKTTLSKALIAEIPGDERLITIEDARELEFHHENSVRLFYSRDGGGTSTVGVQDLLVSCLRMKPNRILLAELRDSEAYFYLRNVNSGHPGSITTVHANSGVGAVEQLMLMIRQSPAGMGLSRTDINGLVTSLVDVIIQMERRQVTEIYVLPEIQ
jgi:type IV secretion system protein VirB11